MTVKRARKRAAEPESRDCNDENPDYETGTATQTNLTLLKLREV